MATKNALVAALTEYDEYTENGAITHSTSDSALVDYLSKAGAARNLDGDTLYGLFSAAYTEDRTKALRLLFWTRDARGGAGERRAFREVFTRMANTRPNEVRHLVDLIPEYGRWDDLLSLFNTPLENAALRKIASALEAKDNLCAKWMPRKGANANKVRAYLQLAPKAYRKLLVNLTNVVETAMCSREYKGIEYGKLPSLASARYQNAFTRNDPAGYNAFLEKVMRGEEKINASAIFPHDVVKALNSGNKVAASAQWANLPNYVEDSGERVLVVCDTSGSMMSRIASGTTAMDVSVSLALYFSERLTGAFKDTFITFSQSPKLQVVSGNLYDRYTQVSRADWGYNTDLQAVFNLILNAAKRKSVSEDEMPTTVLIVSDMEFDHAVDNSTNYEAIVRKFEAAGFTCPNLVFWNVDARNVRNSPVKASDDGTALVSGFSPATLAFVLGTEAPEVKERRTMTPEQIMENIVQSERYEPITAA